MPAVAVWAEPPAMPASGKSEVPDLNSTRSRSRPNPSAAICASAVQAPCPMSCAPISITPVPSRADRRARLGLEHQRREGRRAHAPADQQAGIVAHLPRRQRPLRPAETLGALRITFAQRLRGKRLAGNRLDFGVVLQPERQRIHAAGMRHLVDRAFQRDRPGRLAGRAHEQRRAGIEPNRLMRGGDRGAGVQRVRGVGGGLEEIVERARSHPGVVIDARSDGPRSSAPMRSRWRLAERCPTGPYICSRRSTSLTGRPTIRAARMPRICGPEISPFEPKPPPRNGLRM